MNMWICGPDTPNPLFFKNLRKKRSTEHKHPLAWPCLAGRQRVGPLPRGARRKNS